MEHKKLSKEILFSFLITFIIARSIVFYTMVLKHDNFYLHIGSLHVHHFVYGIILLSGIVLYLLYYQPKGRYLECSALLVGVAFALIFDEFGIWLRLNVNYYQRASIDAVFSLSIFFIFLSYIPSWKQWQTRDVKMLGILVVFLIFFAGMVGFVGRHLDGVYGQELYDLESRI